MLKRTWTGANVVAQLGGPRSTMDSVLASHPAAPGSNLGVPKKIFLLLDVAELIDRVRTVQ